MIGSLLIFIGILCIVVGIMDKRREKRQDDFNDWCYDSFEYIHRNKRRGPKNRRE